MRMIVFFDLPVETSKNRRDYRKFRKMLIKEGFIMMQESVYSKLALNNSVITSITQKLEKNKPPEGIIQTLVVTEKQFSTIEVIVGKVSKEVIDTTERLLIL